MRKSSIDFLTITFCVAPNHADSREDRLELDADSGWMNRSRESKMRSSSGPVIADRVDRAVVALELCSGSGSQTFVGVSRCRPKALQKQWRNRKNVLSKVRAASRGEAPASSSWSAQLADVCLIVLFLVLTCLLGSFRLKDADIYWHLRTGDLIRQTGQIPRTDIFTFTREGVPGSTCTGFSRSRLVGFIKHGGVVGLNVAKCAVTCLPFCCSCRPVGAIGRCGSWSWPGSPLYSFWEGGCTFAPKRSRCSTCRSSSRSSRRWDRFPRLTWVLPFVQIAWVNSHGLFVLGPIILIFALVDAALRFGLFAAERRKWWRTILAASVATSAACLVNPYFIAGALYPIELAGTMRNPIFSKNVAELMTIPDFLKSTGLSNLPMQLHLLAMLVGALSFLLPLIWLVRVRLAANRNKLA